MGSMLGRLLEVKSLVIVVWLGKRMNYRIVIVYYYYN